MNRTDYEEEFPQLLRLTKPLRSWEGEEYKIKFIVDNVDEDEEFAPYLIKLKIYFLDDLQYLNTHNVYLYTDGHFLVIRPLFDGGRLIPTPICSCPSIDTWNYIFSIWLSGFAEQKRTVGRARVLKHELILRTLSDPCI